MQIEETSTIDPRLRNNLLAKYRELVSKHELVIGEELDGYYTTFRNKFGPEKLLALEGEELLLTLKGGKEHDSLNYWLEFKNDATFPAIFGSVAGGSSHKYGLFLKVNTGKWISGQPKTEKEVSQEQAIEIAKLSL